jgi:5-methylcytosine-specific restriction enzyme A
MARPKKDWRLWYSRADWRRKRALQLKREPLCERCKARGMAVPATIADHRVPHHGDFSAFIHGELVSLCMKCHAPKWADDKRGFRNTFDENGKPTDPRHPALQERGPWTKDWSDP